MRIESALACSTSDSSIAARSRAIAASASALSRASSPAARAFSSMRSACAVLRASATQLLALRRNAGAHGLGFAPRLIDLLARGLRLGEVLAHQLLALGDDRRHRLEEEPGK